MGNNHGKSKSKASNIPLNRELNKQITETLGIETQKESVNIFKEGLKRKIHRQILINSNIRNNYLNDDGKVLELSQKFMNCVFDSNLSPENYKNDITSCGWAYYSMFNYDILEEETNNKIKANFMCEKNKDLNNLLGFTSNPDKEEPHLVLTKSIESVDKECNSKIKLNSKEEKSEINNDSCDIDSNSEKNKNYNASENKKNTHINFITQNGLNEVNDLRLNTSESEKKMGNNNFISSIDDLSKDLKEFKDVKQMTDYVSSKYRDTVKIDFKSDDHGFNSENYQKSLDLLTTSNSKLKSKSKTKKRIYTKPPVVNIKINLKDIIKQNIAENTLINTSNNLYAQNENQFKQTTKKVRDALDITLISKDQNISNVNDGSFMDMVDILSESRPFYKDLTRSNRSFRTPSKSPKHSGIDTKNSQFSRILNSELEDRKNRIKYKNNAYNSEKPMANVNIA